MNTADPSPQSSPPRLSGKVIVIGFLILVVGGTIGSILIARQMRPATQKARENVMPLAGKVQVNCVLPDGSARDLSEKGSEKGTCPPTGALTFSVLEPGRGIAQITFAVLTQSPEQPPLVGQFTREGTGRVELNGLEPGPYMAAFIYTNEPIDPAGVKQAIAGAPKGDIPLQEQALEVFISDRLRAKKESRLARVYFRVTP